MGIAATPAGWARRRSFRRGLGWLAAAVGIYLVLRWFEHHQVYFPSRGLELEVSALGRPGEDVFLTTADRVRLHGWFFAAATNRAGIERIVLFFHGNGGNISHRVGYYEALWEEGFAVLAIDYRGYGRSAGRPSEAGTYLDAQAAYAWARQRGYSATNIIALGKSLGGGVAVELALRESVGGLIVQSSYTSIVDIGSEIFPWLPVRWLASIKYDTIHKLPGIKVPVLVLHSRVDTIIPFHHGERNYAAANGPKLFWEIYGDHNDTLESDPARYREGLAKFRQLLEAKSVF